MRKGAGLTSCSLRLRVSAVKIFSAWYEIRIRSDLQNHIRQ
jgi:hypothetical protein